MLTKLSISSNSPIATFVSTNLNLNPILRGNNSNLSYLEGGLLAPLREFALSGPTMHQKYENFIPINYKQFLDHRKF